MEPKTSKYPISAQELENLDRKYLIHPHQRPDRHERYIISSAKDCTVWDVNGREFLDVMGAGNWAVQVGHGRPELAEAARRQIAELEYFTGFNDFSNESAIRLAARLVEVAPDRIGKVFFTGSGSESVEAAMKAARLYHHRRGEESRTWIISREFGYHGCTFGSGTATGWPPMQQGIGPNLPHIAKVSAPIPYHSELYDGEDPTEFLIRQLRSTIDEIGAENIAAMIGEPIIGGGGVHIPPEDYWPRVTELLHDNGILLIADEVITAFGRTGAWFDSPQRGLDPDLITTAKGLTSGYVPLGATLMSDEIAEVITGPESFFHGHTYSGHPVACAIALENLGIIEGDGLLAQAEKISQWFTAGLAEAPGLPFVGDVRIAGAMAGVELVADKAARSPLSHPFLEGIVDEIREAHGVIVRPYPNTVVMAPPLILSQDQAQRACTAVLEVLSRVRGDGILAPR